MVTSRWKDWHQAAVAAICKCGHPLANHLNGGDGPCCSQPIYVGEGAYGCRSCPYFRPKEAPRVTTHMINGVEVYSDQWGRPMEAIPRIEYQVSRKEWRTVLKQLQLV